MTTRMDPKYANKMLFWPIPITDPQTALRKTSNSFWSEPNSSALGRELPCNLRNDYRDKVRLCICIIYKLWKLRENEIRAYYATRQHWIWKPAKEPAQRQDQLSIQETHLCKVLFSPLALDHFPPKFNQYLMTISRFFKAIVCCLAAFRLHWLLSCAWVRRRHT